MAKLSAKNGIILVDGGALSSDAYQYTIDCSTVPLNVTGFRDGWQNYIPGIYTGSMAIDFFWNTSAGRATPTLKTTNTAKIVTLIPMGYALGNPAFSMQSVEDKLTIGAPVTDSLKLGQVTFMTNSADGGPWPGWVLAHDTIDDTQTGTGFVDPTDAAVTARCGGFLHIWDTTSSDTYVIKIQHSDAIGGVYADLVTFTMNGTASGAEAINVASGTINKYRRVVATRTGSAGETLGYAVVFWHSAY